MSNQQEQRCPVCGKVYTERPAVSRKDSKMNICPDCGMREAIEALAQSRRMTQGKAAMGGMTLQEAVNTLDGVIPAPDNKMVDFDHLPIAVAWQECKKALATYSNMQDNAPLTREELLEMDGEPVWIEYIPSPGEEFTGLWALVSIDKEYDEIFLLNSIGGSSSYEEAWADIRAIYRRKPEVCGK